MVFVFSLWVVSSMRWGKWREKQVLWRGGGAESRILSWLCGFEMNG